MLNELNEYLKENFSHDDWWESGGCVELARAIGKYLTKNKIGWAVGIIEEENNDWELQGLHWFIVVGTNALDMYGVRDLDLVVSTWCEDYPDAAYCEHTPKTTKRKAWKKWAEDYNCRIEDHVSIDLEVKACP